MRSYIFNEKLQPTTKHRNGAKHFISSWPGVIRCHLSEDCERKNTVKFVRKRAKKFNDHLFYSDPEVSQDRHQEDCSPAPTQAEQRRRNQQSPRTVRLEDGATVESQNLRNVPGQTLHQEVTLFVVDLNPRLLETIWTIEDLLEILVTSPTIMMMMTVLMKAPILSLPTKAFSSLKKHKEVILMDTAIVKLILPWEGPRFRAVMK